MVFSSKKEENRCQIGSIGSYIVRGQVDFRLAPWSTALPSPLQRRFQKTKNTLERTAPTSKPRAVNGLDCTKID